MVTIRDVARDAGVSVSTVSLALNQPSRVGEATRVRVLAAADALGFVPKPQATQLARRRAPRIGVIGPFSSHSTAAERLAGILTGTDVEKVDLVVFDQPSAETAVTPLMAALPRSGRLDGLLVVSLPVDAALVERAAQLDLPLVLLDTGHPGVVGVVTDDVEGGRIAARHFASRGAKTFGFLGEAHAADYRSPSDARLQGYRDELARLGHRLITTRILLTAGGLDAATDAATELLRRNEHLALLAANDHLAAAALRAARRLERAVPEQLQIIGYDDGELARALDITTVQQPLRKSGAIALELLRSLLDGRPPARTITLRPQLVARDTA